MMNMDKHTVYSKHIAHGIVVNLYEPSDATAATEAAEVY